MNHNYCFGELSKTNVFIGENNSGKSRFLRYLFKTDFHSLSYENFKKFFNEMNYNITPYGNYGIIYDFYHTLPQPNKEKFIKLYDKINSNKELYRNVNFIFLRILEDHHDTHTLNNKFYFPIIRGTKDYKTIINNKLDTFLKSADSIQNKDAINHYISLLNLDAKGLESFDIYNDVITYEYFNDNKDIKGIKERILTGGKLYNEIKSMLLGDGSQREVIEKFQNWK